MIDEGLREGNSSVMVRWMTAVARPASASARRFAAPPVSTMVGLPPGRLTTPMSARTRPAQGRCRAPWSRPPWRRTAWRRRPRGSCGGRTCARSMSVKQRSVKRSPKRSSDFSTRRMSMRSLPMPMIMRFVRRAAADVKAALRPCLQARSHGLAAPYPAWLRSLARAARRSAGGCGRRSRPSR